MINTDKVNQHSLAPITDSQRIEVMDVLRGFALCGIIFMNIEWFNRAMVEIGRFEFQLTGMDWGSSWLVKLFIEGKFYKLFSLIFGMGFAVMLLQAKRKGRPFFAWFSRRMGTLFAIGMIHMSFIWGGDFLHDYAVGGMILLFWVWLLKFKWMQWANNERSFLRVGLAILSIPFVISLCLALFFGSTQGAVVHGKDYQLQVAVEQRVNEIKQNQLLEAPLIESAIGERIGTQKRPEMDEDALGESELIVYKSERRFISRHKRALDSQAQEAVLKAGTYIEIISYWAKNAIGELAKTPIMVGIISFPLFLIGYWFVASGVIVKLKEHIGFYKVLAWVGLGVGVTISAGALIITSNEQAKFIRDFRIVGDFTFFLGQYLMSAGYLALVVLPANSDKTKRIIHSLEPMGKMALTNYLMQSLILAFIFYSFGLGLFGEIPRFAQLGIAVLILIFQGVLSTIWLKYFRYGPMEWVWRSLSYKQMQPFRLVAKTPISANHAAHV